MSGEPQPLPALGALHLRRLRAMWRSAGWPCQDMVELELLAAGALQRHTDAQGRETLRLTDAGIALLARSLERNRAARDAHEALVQRVALQAARAGRITWRGLRLRAPLPGDDGRTRWVMALPDVFSIRHTTVEALVQPVVHEIKVRRADLLADLRRPDKRAAYLALGSECWYVLQQGIGEAAEIPLECGVMMAAPDGSFEVARPAPKRAAPLPLALWMALARATPEPGLADDDAQWPLADAD